MTCPQTEQLTDFALGKLPEEQSEVLAQHIETCPECSTTIETLDRAADTLVSCLVGQPAPAIAENDSQYERAAQRVKQIGREPSQSPAERSGGAASELSELGQLREYKLLAKLGQGGMGAVYKALHTRLERVVALKVLPAERMQDAAAVARFSREMKAVGRLDHPHIVRAMDAGEVDGKHFLVMEYVQGEDLSDLIARRGPLPVAAACELIRQAAIGLQHAHEHGLVHRDIKPSNLMLAVQKSGDRGQVTGDSRQVSATVKILDLGLALLDMQPEGAGELTGSGQLMGTADYMAPEQATDTHRVDIRADIYSLGATLYKLLIGQAPFVGERYPTAISKIMAHATHPVPALRDKRPEVPAELEAVVAKMLAKTPEERYATPVELAEALAPFARGADLAALCDAPAAGAGGAVDRSRVTTSKLNASEGSNTSPTVTLSPIPQPVTNSGTVRQPPRRTLWIALAASAAALLLAGVIVIIRDRDGKEIARHNAPDGSSVQLLPGDKPADVPEAKPASPSPAVPAPANRPIGPIVPLPRVPVEPIEIKPETRPAIPAGEPIFPLALTAKPAKIEGLESWTVETHGHRGSVKTVRYSPDGKTIASCGSDGTVRLWDVETSQLLRVLVGALGSVAWSPDGQWLASGGSGGTLQIWESQTGRLAKTIEGLGYIPDSLGWSCGGEFLATIGRAKNLKVFDLRSAECIATLGRGSQASNPGISCHLAWSPDGTRLAFCPDQQRLCIWSVVGRGNLRTFDDMKDVHNVAWSPDGKHLAAQVTDRGPSIVLNVESGEREFQIGGALPVWSPDGKWIAHGGVSISDATTGKLDRKLETGVGVTTIDWSPDSTHIAVGQSNGKVQTFSLTSRLPVMQVSGYPRDQYAGFSWRPQGDQLLFSLRECGLSTFDARTGERRRWITSFAPGGTWTPDGKSISHGKNVWDAQTGERTRTLPAIEGITTSSAYWPYWSPDGGELAIGGGHAFALLSSDADKPRHTFKFKDPYPRPAWDPTGKRVAFKDYSTVLVHDVDSGERLLTIDIGLQDISRTAWSPDGTKIAVFASQSGDIVVHNTTSGNLLSRTKAPAVPTQIDWSDDSQSLLIGCKTSAFRWNLATGGTTPSPDFPRSNPYSPDGLVFGDTKPDQNLRLYTTATGAHLGTIVLLGEHYLTLSPEGHLRGSENIESQILYVAQTPDGVQHTYTPAEFAAKFGWKNDPAKLQLTAK